MPNQSLCSSCAYVPRYARRSSTLGETLASLSICAGIQVALGLPFLSKYPVSYLKKAFELSRVFFFKWTVNLKFLPEEVFISKVRVSELRSAAMSVISNAIHTTSHSTRHTRLSP